MEINIFPQHCYPIAKLNPSPSKTGLTSIIITLPVRPAVRPAARPGKVSSGEARRLKFCLYIQRSASGYKMLKQIGGDPRWMGDI